VERRKKQVKGLIKRSASILAGSTTFDKFVSILERTNGDCSGLLRVLTYHRVDEPDNRPQLYPGLISAAPEDFKRQMEYLARNYCFLSMPELLELVHKGVTLPANALMLTFDDAYCDFSENVWPILQSYRIPVTLFVATAYPDHPERMFWWDRLYHAVWHAPSKDVLEASIGKYSIRTHEEKLQTLGALRSYVKSSRHHEGMRLVDQICDYLDAAETENCVLSWESLKKLSEEGVTLGAHTRTHPLMDQISLEEARDELVGSLQDIQQQIGQAIPVFAYPGGGFNDKVVKILKGEGVHVAFTTVRGINNLERADLHQLRRINIGARTTLQLLRAQLLPLAQHLNAFWSMSGA
jgi:peptidoglycan/xylan/chitin deacetylase (PgdA/CDA1 family)